MPKVPKSEKVPKSDSGLPTIEFTTNWNGKLFTNCFTTIRLWNPTKYEIGREFKCITPTKLHDAPTIWGQVKVIGAKKLTIPLVNDYIAYLDTGYDAEATKGILRKMYTNMINGRDIDLEPFGLYLLLKQWKTE